MDRQWIHGKLVINARGYQCPPQKTFHDRNARGRPHPYQRKEEEIPAVLQGPGITPSDKSFNFSLFLLTTLAITFMALTPLLIIHSKDLSFAILSSEGRSTLFTNTRQEYLARLSFEQQRNFISHVNFIQSVIESAPRSTVNPAEAAFIIVTEAYSANFDPLFVAAVISAESDFQHNAQSPVGAVGLMQLMPATGEYIAGRKALEWKGTRALENPHYNIRLGITYLRYLQTKFENKRHILMAYNWGPGNVNKAIKTGSTRLPEETRNYIRRVLSRYQNWQKTFAERKHEFQFGVPTPLKGRGLSRI